VINYIFVRQEKIHRLIILISTITEVILVLYFFVANCIAFYACVCYSIYTLLTKIAECISAILHGSVFDSLDTRMHRDDEH